MAEPPQYSLEVVRTEGVRSLRTKSRKGGLYVQIKYGNTAHRTGIIEDSGKPASDATFIFSHLDAAAILNVCMKESRGPFPDRTIGFIDIDVAKLLNESPVHEIQGDLTPMGRLFAAGKRTGSAGTIYLHLKMIGLDALSRAEAYIKIAEQNVEPIRSSRGKIDPADSVVKPVIHALNDIIEVIDTVAQIHPLFHLSWQATAALYRLVSHQFVNDGKLVDVVDKMKEMFTFLTEADRLDDRTETLRPIIKELLEETLKCSHFVKEYAGHSFAGRLAHWLDSRKIDEFATRFAELRDKLDSAIGLTIAKTAHEIGIRQSLQTLLELTSMDISNISIRPRCLEGTRKDYLEEIRTRLLSDTGQNATWLTGAAGTGKSTIAVTIADICGESKSSVAYLFFERGKDEYVSAIRAIAFKLAVLHPSIASHIVRIVTENKNISGSILKTQFEKLLLEPLLAVELEGTLEQPIVIILDALDECGTIHQRRDLVRMLTTDLARLPRKIRFLVTSRPESDIMDFLSSTSDVHHIKLEHEAKRSQDDVHLYIKTAMAEAVNEPPDGWTWDDAMRALSHAAGGLFIWASTAVRMVNRMNGSAYRQRKFRALLSDIGSVRGGDIDALYATVLQESGIPWNEPGTSDEFAKILGLVLYAKEAQTGDAVEAFLDLEKGTVDSILGQLRSVLSYGRGKPVRLHHASFADYLTSENYRAEPWNINEHVQKLAIAERCFDIMKEKLRFNICDIETSFVCNDDLPGLQDRIKTQIPQYLDYACRFWAAHTCELPSSHSLGHVPYNLKTFAEAHLLYWFEVLSLTSCYNRVASKALYETSQWSSSVDEELSSFLWGAYRLASTFALPMSRSVPHIYLSAVSLWKYESRVANHYSEAHPIVRVYQSGTKAPARCIKLLEHRRGSWVNSVACSPNGKLIVSASEDKTICIWSADSGERVLGPLEGHSDDIWSVAFSPDGKLVASGSADCSIRVWDADSGKPVHGPLVGHTRGVAEVTFSPDGKRIASGSLDRMIRVWDVNSGTLVFGPLAGHKRPVREVAFSPGGEYLASCSNDGTILLWDAERGESISDAFKGHTGGVYSIAFSPDGRRIASGSYDTTCRVWDIHSGGLVCGPLKGHSGSVRSVSLSPDGKRLASGDEGGAIRIWNADTGELISGPFEGHAKPVTSVVFFPDGKRLASGSGDGTIRIWDVDTNVLVSGSSGGHTGSILSVAFSADSEHLISGSEDRNICFWDVPSCRLVSGPLQAHTGAVKSIAPSPKAMQVASGSSDGTVGIWDAANSKLISGPHEGHTQSVNAVAFSSNGDYVASGSSDGIIGVWESNGSGSVLRPFYGHQGKVLSIVFLSDGKRIASGSMDGTIRVWEIDSGLLISGLFMGYASIPITTSIEGKETLTFGNDMRFLNTVVGRLISRPTNGHSDEILSVAISTSGKFAASGSADGTICVWDVERGELLLDPLVAHAGEVSSVAFSPNEGCIAWGSQDGTLRVLDVHRGKLSLRSLKGHTDQVNSVSFSRDGNSIVSGSTDKTIRIWVTPSTLVSIGRVRVDLDTLQRNPQMSNSDDRKMRKEDVLSDWDLSDDGWVLGAHGELLAWIPEDMRGTLWRARNTSMFNCPFSTRLGFMESPVGEEWCKSFPFS